MGVMSEIRIRSNPSPACGGGVRKADGGGNSAGKKPKRQRMLNRRKTPIPGFAGTSPVNGGRIPSQRRQ